MLTNPTETGKVGTALSLVCDKVETKTIFALEYQMHKYVHENSDTKVSEIGIKVHVGQDANLWCYLHGALFITTSIIG